MNELGDLPPCTWEQIDTVLARFPRLRWVKLYGSRAMGCQRPASDIDLAFSSPEDCSAALAGAFEELPIPYKVDVTHWESLSHAGLRRHIETVGIPLERQPTSAGRLHLTARDADRGGQPSTRGWSPLPTAPTGGNR
jgi:predicted nucleotidyltransferase